MVVNRERAQDGRRVFLAVAEVRPFAGEVFLLHPWRGHPRLHDVVFGLQLVAVRPVALLEPSGGAVHPDAACHEAVRLARLPQRVPELEPLLDRDVELPAQVTDVGDARGQHALGADLDRAAGTELEAVVGDVVGRRPCQNLARAWPPKADGRHRGGRIGQLRPDGEQVAKPLLVRHPARAARDDAEVLVAQAHDRQVGLEAAIWGEDRRVDDASHRNVHLPQRGGLHRSERSGPEDVEDGKGGEVEQACAVAHREVFRVDDRRPPTRLPFGGAAGHAVAVLLQQRRVRLVPLRSLPARCLEEDRPQLTLADMEWREADAAVGGPLLAGVDDAVRLVEAFGRSRAHVRACLLMFVEPGDVRGVEVDLRLAVHHPLRDGLAGAGPFLHPHRGGRPQALHVRRLTKHGHSVRTERQDSVDGVLHADRLVTHDLGHELQRVLHLLLEVRLREGELCRGERCLLDRRQVLRVVEDRPVGVRPDLEVAAGLPLVHVGVHVAHDRVLDVRLRPPEPRDWPDVDHLMHGGRERDARARHAGQARAPHATRDGDGLGLDVTLGRANAPDAAMLDVDPDHLRLGRHVQGA